MVSFIKKNSDIILVSFIVTLLSVSGKLLTDYGLNWYSTLNLPVLTPPNWAFGLVWTFIYLCGACAVISLIRAYKHTGYYSSILGLFCLCAILNPLWSYLFFVHHRIDAALIDCIVIGFNLITIIVLTWKDSRYIALLVLPAALWVAFAIYINYQILLLN
jgi:benzodiazapine receptor